MPPMIITSNVTHCCYLFCQLTAYGVRLLTRQQNFSDKLTNLLNFTRAKSVAVQIPSTTYYRWHDTCNASFRDK